MTVIAWDGKTLAADKQSTICGYAGTTTKVHRVPEGLVAFSGGGSHAAELLRWFQAGRPEGAFPKSTEELGAGSTFITKDGQVLLCSYHGPFPEVVEDKFFARGCGRDYALAAMHLGHDARTAVEVACALDVNCGMGIDTLELE